MRALMNFQYSDGWSFRIMAEDQQTPLVPGCTIGKRETLLSFIDRLHGDVAKAKLITGHENEGCVWINISEEQIAALRAYKRRTIRRSVRND